MLLVTIISLAVGILLTIFFSILEVNERIKEIKEKDELNKVYSLIDKIEKEYGYYINEVASGGLVDRKMLVEVFDNIRKIKLITKKDEEKFYLLMYKYQEHFNIILSQFERASKFSLLDDPVIHEEINKLLLEPLKDIKKMQSIENASVSLGEEKINA